MSFTENNFAEVLIGGADSGSVTISIPAGHSIGCVALERNFVGQVAGTFSDSAGNSYTPGTFTTIPNHVQGCGCSLAIPNAVTSVTYTTGTPGTDAFFLYVWDITATGIISLADSDAVGYISSPATTDGVTTKSLSVTSSDAFFFGAGKDWSSGNLSAGTGFTQDPVDVSNLGEHKAATSSGPVTFTSVGGNTVSIAAMALQLAGTGPTIGILISPQPRPVYF
jgi:hypothetical protein